MATAGGDSSPEEMPLDAEMLKVLAADTRRDILRLLQKRRMTLTEMAAALDLKKATVLEHLQKLTAVGLIRRVEDERLWVYYELTPRGGRLVTPGKTRFYLVMAGIAAAALLMGGVATVALIQADDHTLPVTMRTAPVGGGVVLELDLAIPADAGVPQVYLLSASAPADATGTPLLVTPRGAGLVTVRTHGPLAAGDYRLLVVSAEGEDNRDALVPLRVPAFAAAGPAAATVGIDEPPTFRVLRDGAPVDGTLLLTRTDGAASLSATARAGAATLDAARFDALPPGAYALAFRPDGAAVAAPLPASLTVRASAVALTPLHALEGKAYDLTLGIPGHAGATPAVTLDDDALDVTTVAEGDYRVALPALPPGEATLRIGRVERTLTVHPDHALALAPLADGRIGLRATDATGAPSAGVDVTLDAVALGATDADGYLAFTPPPPGVARLRLEDADGVVERALRFRADAVEEEAAELSIRNVTYVASRAGADVANDGVATVALTLEAEVADRLHHAEALVLRPGESRHVDFDLAYAPAGTLELRAAALELPRLTWSARDVAAEPPTVTVARPYMDAVATPTVATQAPTTPTVPSGALGGTPSPEVPFPWALTLAALVAAAVLVNRRRKA